MVKYIKLIYGEEIIAQIESCKDQVCLINPVAMSVGQDATGKIGIAMRPWMPFSNEKKVVISKNHILFQLEPNEDIKNAYNQQFGNGIVTATANVLGQLDRSHGLQNSPQILGE